MTDANDVLLACDMAVRLSLEAASKMVRNHRGRDQRARYQHVPDDRLYLQLDPPATAIEMDRFAEKFDRWWGLPSVLNSADIPNYRLYMAACQEYVRTVMLSQTEHQPANLLAYLSQADVVATSTH